MGTMICLLFKTLVYTAKGLLWLIAKAGPALLRAISAL